MGCLKIPYNNYLTFTKSKKGACRDYLFGFNTQQREDDIAGIGNHNMALFGELDTRLGRRWNLDPKPNAGASVYSVFNNSPILFTDVLLDTPNKQILLGLSYFYIKQGGLIKIGNQDIINQMNSLWQTSFPNSQPLENGATIVLNIKTKKFEFINIGGRERTEGGFKSDLRFDASKYILAGTLHTHPYGKDDGSGFECTIDAQDVFAAWRDNETFSIAIGTKSLYMVVFSEKTNLPTWTNNEKLNGENLSKLNEEFMKDAADFYYSFKTDGVTEKEARSKAFEHAMTLMSKRYNFSFFKANRKDAKFEKKN